MVVTPPQPEHSAAEASPTGAHRFSVAPMLDYTDRHFRMLMRQISRRSLLYTEMVVAQALHHCRLAAASGDARAQARLERLIGFDGDERPLALQLGGDDPALLAEATRIAAARGYDEVNLNVGCPSEKVQKGRFGACLMADPDQVAPLRHDLVHQLKRDRPALTIELNGGLQDLESCRQHLQLVDGVMVGRATYDHPLRWAEVDRLLFGDAGQPPATASTVVRGLIPHAERWCSGGGRLWAIARHLVQVVEGVSGARHWRRDLGVAAGDRSAGPEVLEQAARQLEERGL